MKLSKEIVPFVNELKRDVIGFENLFTDLVHRTDMWETNYPKDNVISYDNKVIIMLALAGFGKGDIAVTRDGASLMVTGSHEDAEEVDGATYLRRNIATRSFTKRYTISAEYKNVEAIFENGILRLTFEKEPVEDTTQVIEIT